MRILVISDLPQFVTGGAEMQTARLIEAWMGQGHEVICLGRRMGQGPVNVGNHTVEVRRIRTLRFAGRWGRGVSYFLSLAGLFLRYQHRVDVIYTRFLGEAAITVSLLKRAGLVRIPLIATPASAGDQGDVRFLYSIPGSRKLIRLLDDECDAINLISSRMAQELTKAGLSGRHFSHIPNGVPVFPTAQRRPIEKVRFIAVGRLLNKKVTMSS